MSTFCRLKNLPLAVVAALAWCAGFGAAQAQEQIPEHVQEHVRELEGKLLAASEVELVLPHDLILTPDGRHLVVADMGQDRIVLLDAETLAFAAAFGAAEGLSFPHDVAFDDQGRLMVADTGNDRIVFYALDGLSARQVDAWTGLDGVEGVLQVPGGSVYAALVVTNQVVRLDGQGRITVRAGSALGMMLDRPHDIALANDRAGTAVIATDPGNHRLIVFDASLKPLYEISTWDPPFTEPKYISTTPDGTVFVADPFLNRVRVLSAASEELGQLAVNAAHLPEGVHIQGARAWISDTERGRVVLYQMGETR